MIQLKPNQAGSQLFYITPYERRKDFPAVTHYLIEFVSRASQKSHTFVASTTADNKRYTAVSVQTDTDNINNVLLTDGGLYDYKVYGQNSATNTDTDSPKVVGVFELGTLVVTDEAVHTFPTISIPTDIIYYE